MGLAKHIHIYAKIGTFRLFLTFRMEINLYWYLYSTKPEVFNSVKIVAKLSNSERMMLKFVLNKTEENWIKDRFSFFFFGVGTKTRHKTSSLIFLFDSNVCADLTGAKAVRIMSCVSGLASLSLSFSLKDFFVPWTSSCVSGGLVPPPPPPLTIQIRGPLLPGGNGRTA